MSGTWMMRYKLTRSPVLQTYIGKQGVGRVGIVVHEELRDVVWEPGSRLPVLKELLVCDDANTGIQYGWVKSVSCRAEGG